VAVLEGRFGKLCFDGCDQLLAGDDVVCRDSFNDHPLDGAFGFRGRGFRNCLLGGFGLGFCFLLLLVLPLISPVSMGSRVIAALRALICRELSAMPRTKLG
jgi:hypothetical protein